DRSTIAHFLNQVAAAPADGKEGIVIDLATFDDWNDVIQEFNQPAENPALGLAAQAEEDHVVPGEDGIHNLRNDGFFIADDAGENRRLCLELANQIHPHLVFDGSPAIGRLSEWTRL